MIGAKLPAVFAAAGSTRRRCACRPSSAAARAATTRVARLIRLYDAPAGAGGARTRGARRARPGVRGAAAARRDRRAQQLRPLLVGRDSLERRLVKPAGQPLDATASFTAMKNLVKELRRARGLSQGQLRDTLCASRQTSQLIEKERYVPSSARADPGAGTSRAASRRCSHRMARKYPKWLSQRPRSSWAGCLAAFWVGG